MTDEQIRQRLIREITNKLDGDDPTPWLEGPEELRYILALLQEREPVERDPEATEWLKEALHRCSGFEIIEDVEDGMYHVYAYPTFLASHADPITAMTDDTRAWIIDASMEPTVPGVFCFCPISWDEKGDLEVQTGMNMIGGIPESGTLYGVFHPDGQEAVDAFCERWEKELTKLFEGERVDEADEP